MVGTCLEAPPVRLFSSERPIRRPDIFCKKRQIRRMAKKNLEIAGSEQGKVKSL
jgi:hypothetical protein